MYNIFDYNDIKEQPRYGKINKHIFLVLKFSYLLFKVKIS